MVVAELRGAGKSYRVGRAAYGTFRDLFLRRRAGAERIEALECIDLSCEAGEVVGLVGDNGAGKSTVLKLLAGITPPDRGRVAVAGRVSALIEIGAGFHPELTGRENALFHGALLGVAHREMQARLDDIVTFADLQTRIDHPLKQWSTGMIARLGFSVAVHVDPALLLVDEVLSVGDQDFRARCEDRLAQLKTRGTAILFVSHDVPAVARVADRVLWLEGGRIRAQGAPQATLEAYTERKRE